MTFDWASADPQAIYSVCQRITRTVLEEVAATRAGLCEERGGEAFQSLYEQYGSTGILTAISATATAMRTLLDESGDTGMVAVPVDPDMSATVEALIAFAFAVDDPAGTDFFDALYDLWETDQDGVIIGWHMLVHIAADIDAPRATWARLIAGTASQN